MKRLKDPKWWEAAGTRAIKTFAQALLGSLGTCALVYEVDWSIALGAGAMAAILSLVMSLNGLPEVEE